MKALQDRVMRWLGVQETQKPLPLTKSLLCEYARGRNLWIDKSASWFKQIDEVACLTRIDSILLPRLSSSDKNRCRGIDVLGVRLRTWLEQTELEALTKFFVELLLLNPVMVIFYDSYSGRMAVGVRNRAGDPLSVMELIEEPIWMGKALQDALPCDVRTAFLRLCEPFGKDSLNAKIRELSLRLNKATGTKRKALEKQLSELLAQQSAKPTTNEDT